MAQPIGFNATWSFLQEQVGRSWRDPEFLLPAVALLEAERSLRLEAAVEYALLRREQKAAGHRFPAREDVTPTAPRRWHGRESLGAVHALKAWRHLRTDQAVADHPLGSRVVAEVDRVLGASPSTGAIAELQPILDWVRRQVWVVGWETEPSEYQVAWVLLDVLGQLYLTANGAPAVGAAWNLAKD
ncbi:MAG: hypothetical protein QM286_03680 [Acidobacteriota bacterium]|nr:hypothetical protein [Acidobacteriota bacterium]